MHHTELYLGIRFLIVGIALAYVFVPLVWGRPLEELKQLTRAD
jgi:hypothetical protein